MMDEGRGVRVEGERLSVKEERSGGELGSDLDLDSDPWKILWIRIRIRQNDADPLDPDPQHCATAADMLLSHLLPEVPQQPIYSCLTYYPRRHSS